MVPLTFVPPFPAYPPETSWMREPRTDIPALILSQRGKSRIAFLPADIDRRYAREHLTDHGDQLANVVRWAAGDSIPLSIQGRGYLDCHLYRQPGRPILHVVNLTSAGTWRAPVEEFIPVGPIQVRVKLPSDAAPREARLLVSEGARPVTVKGGEASFELVSILDHEAVVIPLNS